MYIRKSTRTYKRKTYTKHILVESVQTAKGPRHRTICSLGSLAPAPAEDWRGLARKLSAALGGQTALVPDPAVEALAARARPARRRPRPVPPAPADVGARHADPFRGDGPTA